MQFILNEQTSSFAVCTEPKESFTVFSYYPAYCLGIKQSKHGSMLLVLVDLNTIFVALTELTVGESFFQ